MTETAEFVRIWKPGLERLGVVTVRSKRVGRWTAKGWREGSPPEADPRPPVVGRRRRSQKERLIGG